MFTSKLSLPLAAVGLVASLFLPASGFGQGIVNQPVWFTFANPVVLPGATLQPGQYEFRQANTRSDREVIEVYNHETGKHVVTAFAVGTSLSNDQPVPEKAEIRFYEASANSPATVRSWWYPGVREGHEFIYPKEQAETLAKINQNVLTAEGDVESGKLTHMGAEAGAEQPKSSAAMAAPVELPTPAPAPSVTPQPMDTMAQAATSEPRERRALPHTASSMPVFVAVGLLSLITGVALMTRRRSA